MGGGEGGGAAARAPARVPTLRPTLLSGGIASLGAAVTFLSDGPLRAVGVAAMLAGAVACFVALAELDETEPDALPFSPSEE
jgi:uncharacterized protein YjeT (DUF2065 family)